MDEVRLRYFKIDPKDVVFLKAILESYEGMTVLRTTDGEHKIIEVWINPYFSREINAVLQELQSTVPMHEVAFEQKLPWVP